MSPFEIIAELETLSPQERSVVYQRLVELYEADLAAGAGPTEEERRLLDEALAEYERDGERGIPWREAFRHIRAEDRV